MVHVFRCSVNGELVFSILNMSLIKDELVLGTCRKKVLDAFRFEAHLQSNLTTISLAVTQSRGINTLPEVSQTGVGWPSLDACLWFNFDRSRTCSCKMHCTFLLLL